MPTAAAAGGCAAALQYFGTRAVLTLMARRTAARVRRTVMPGKSSASCKQEPGALRPLVELTRCEGKGDCVRVCPESVFEIRRIADVDYLRLGLLHRFKQRVHGM